MDRTDELIERFNREYCEMNSITEKRRTEQFVLLRKFAATLDHPLDELTPQDMQHFIGDELKAGLHVNTGRKHLGMIRSFITWGMAAGLISAERYLQLKTVRNPRGSTKWSQPNPYKTSEIPAFRALLSAKYPALAAEGQGSRALTRFLAGKVPRMRTHLWRHAKRLQFEAQVALALEGGLRRIEIYNLSIPSMHYDNDEIVVLTAKQGPGREVRRSIPYTTHMRTCVEEWLDFRRVLCPDHEHPWLALAYNGGGVAAQLAPLDFLTFGRSLERSFGCYWRWHRFRHTCATEWLRSGVPIEKVSLLMGHSNLEQTRAYVKIVKSDMESAFGAAEADFARRLGLAA